MYEAFLYFYIIKSIICTWFCIWLNNYLIYKCGNMFSIKPTAFMLIFNFLWSIVIYAHCFTCKAIVGTAKCISFWKNANFTSFTHVRFLKPYKWHSMFLATVVTGRLLRLLNAVWIISAILNNVIGLFSLSGRVQCWNRLSLNSFKPGSEIQNNSPYLLYNKSLCVSNAHF